MQTKDFQKLYNLVQLNLAMLLSSQSTIRNPVNKPRTSLDGVQQMTFIELYINRKWGGEKSGRRATNGLRSAAEPGNL